MDEDDEANDGERGIPGGLEEASVCVCVCVCLGLRERESLCTERKHAYIDLAAGLISTKSVCFTCFNREFLLRANSGVPAALFMMKRAELN